MSVTNNIRTRSWRQAVLLSLVLTGVPVIAQPEKTSAILDGKNALKERDEKLQRHRDRWNAYETTPFQNLGPRYEHMVIDPAPGGDLERLPPELERSLNQQLRYFIQTLRARTFVDFVEGLKASHRDCPKLRTAPVIRNEMAKKHLLQQPDIVPDTELLELYWSVHTDFGQGIRYYDSIALKQSGSWPSGHGRHEHSVVVVNRHLKLG